MIPILIKSNYPKVNLVTIEYKNQTKEFTASNWNDITKNVKSNFDIRNIVEQLEWEN